jgi:hypothetical protein
MGVLLRPGQHLDGAEDGNAGLDEGEELLIEDEEGFELDLALAFEAKAGAVTRARNSSAVAAVCTCSWIRPRSSASLMTNSAMLPDVPVAARRAGGSSTSVADSRVTAL